MRSLLNPEKPDEYKVTTALTATLVRCAVTELEAVGCFAGRVEQPTE